MAIEMKIEDFKAHEKADELTAIPTKKDEHHKNKSIKFDAITPMNDYFLGGEQVFIK